MTMEPKDESGFEDGGRSFTVDDATCRIQDGSIHVKVVTGYGDPVELNVYQARLFGAALLTLADRLEAEEGT